MWDVAPMISLKAHCNIRFFEKSVHLSRARKFLFALPSFYGYFQQAFL
jgi:hypothetical protein